MSAHSGVPQFRRHPHRDTTWQKHANCVDANPRIFHDPARYGEALAVCAPCPVKRQCRESRTTGDDGVWGGRVYGRPPGRPKQKQVSA